MRDGGGRAASSPILLRRCRAAAARNARAAAVARQQQPRGPPAVSAASSDCIVEETDAAATSDLRVVAIHLPFPTRAPRPMPPLLLLRCRAGLRKRLECADGAVAAAARRGGEC